MSCLGSDRGCLGSSGVAPNAVAWPQVQFAGADSPGMESFLITLGYGALALLGVAVAVALWEHMRRPSRTRAPQAALPGPASAPVRVDVDLDALTPLPDDDQLRRRSTVETAMVRMARPAAISTGAQAWTETRPMVSPGTQAESESQ